MAKTVKTITYGGTNKSRKIALARQAVARARTILRGRTLGPAGSRGYYGVRSRMSRGELKTVDVDQSAYQADTTGTVTLLNGIATGTDFTNRIGRKVLLKSIYIKGWLSNTDTTTANTMCRLAIVYDSQSNAAAPAITDVFKSINGTTHLNLDNRDRFRILYDKHYALASVDNTATQAIAGSPTIFPVKLYRKLNLEEQFSGIAATIGSISTGAIYMMTFSSATPTNGGAFTVSTRIRFQDS